MPPGRASSIPSAKAASTVHICLICQAHGWRFFSREEVLNSLLVRLEGLFFFHWGLPVLSSSPIIVVDWAANQIGANSSERFGKPRGESLLFLYQQAVDTPDLHSWISIIVASECKRRSGSGVVSSSWHSSLPRLRRMKQGENTDSPCVRQGWSCISNDDSGVPRGCPGMILEDGLPVLFP